MANYFNIVLDTAPPSNIRILIEEGNIKSNDILINCNILTDDVDSSNYEMKIWGDVNNLFNKDIQNLEGNSSWIPYSTQQRVKLSSGDGIKNIYLKIKDDLQNESDAISDDILLYLYIDFYLDTSESLIMNIQSIDTEYYLLSESIENTFDLLTSIKEVGEIND